MHAEGRTMCAQVLPRQNHARTGPTICTHRDYQDEHMCAAELHLHAPGLPG
jgi:hypothetical protein